MSEVKAISAIWIILQFYIEAGVYMEKTVRQNSL